MADQRRIPSFDNPANSQQTITTDKSEPDPFERGLVTSALNGHFIRYSVQLLVQLLRRVINQPVTRQQLMHWETCGRGEGDLLGFEIGRQSEGEGRFL